MREADALPSLPSTPPYPTPPLPPGPIHPTTLPIYLSLSCPPPPAPSSTLSHSPLRTTLPAPPSPSSLPSFPPSRHPDPLLRGYTFSIFTSSFHSFSLFCSSFSSPSSFFSIYSSCSTSTIFSFFPSSPPPHLRLHNISQVTKCFYKSINLSKLALTSRNKIFPNYTFYKVWN